MNNTNPYTVTCHTVGSDDESHPLAELMEVVGLTISDYERQHHPTAKEV